MINRESGRGLELILKFIAWLFILGGFIIFTYGGSYYNKMQEISRFTTPVLKFSLFIAGIAVIFIGIVILWLGEMLNHSINQTSLLLDIKTELTYSNSKETTIQNVSTKIPEEYEVIKPKPKLEPKPKPKKTTVDNFPHKNKDFKMPRKYNKPKKKRRSISEILHTDIKDLFKRKD